jgi:hypothetical protein
VLIHEAMSSARRSGRGLRRSAVPVLHGFEFRWIVDTPAGTHAGPNRFWGDFTDAKLYLPQHYYRVPAESRMWFYAEDMGEALTMGFMLLQV